MRLGNDAVHKRQGVLAKFSWLQLSGKWIKQPASHLFTETVTVMTKPDLNPVFVRPACGNRDPARASNSLWRY